MATNVTDTYDIIKGIREDLSDTIWDVSPTETPFISNCARVAVKNTLFEWQTDSLAAKSATTAIEGADASFSKESDTSRPANRTEIITKTAVVSGTADAVDLAGRRSEMARLVIKRGKEIRRDMEHHAVGVSQIQVAGDGTATARKTASYNTWTLSNDTGTPGASPANRGTTGTGPVGGDGTDAPGDGTQRAFDEAILGAVIDACWNSGGEPDVIMCGSFTKRAMNAFTGNATEANLAREPKKIINAVTLYESDYGTMSVVPNRFVRTREVLVYQSDMWKVGLLRDMRNTPIAKTGDSEKRQVLIEWGLMACNEASSGICADLTDS